MADLTAMMQAAAGAAGGENLYIEDVFSTYLYTGNGSTKTITNGIDLDGEGGLTWIKWRSGGGLGSADNCLFDTQRGPENILFSNTTQVQNPFGVATGSLTAFNNNGFSLGSDALYGRVNTNNGLFASWTFRKAPKFFDVVTYTGNGVAGREIAHELGSVPGCIIVKRLDSTGNWYTYHRSLGDVGGFSFDLKLNLTNNREANQAFGAGATQTSTHFTLGSVAGPIAEYNGSGNTYVAYLFAHDDGGFGDDGEQNVISCGSFTVDANGDATVNLAYEPQFVIAKPSSTTGNWQMFDNMRGLNVTLSARLYPNLSNAEDTTASIKPTATGFTVDGNFGAGEANATYIYIAIRRGPMKTPTAGTEVFGLSARTGTGANATVTGSAGVSDAVLVKNRGSAVASLFSSRLTGTGYLVTSTTAAEVAAATTILQANPWDVMDGVKVGTTSTITNASGNTFINYLFSRAPGFFDVVCYTGTGSATTVAHNLGVVPELMIVKSRNNVTNWAVYSAYLGGVNPANRYVLLNSSQTLGGTAVYWNDTAPTSSVFTVGTTAATNTSSYTYVAYLFASLAGVSKVGSYTGNGTSISVTTGFQPRFILVKRTDSTGNWYVGDSARGLVAGDDPFLELNTTDAEVTNEDWVDVSATGFTINETAANANVDTGTYIYLAIS